MAQALPHFKFSVAVSLPSSAAQDQSHTLPNRRYDMDLYVKPGRPAALGFGITLDVLGAIAVVGGGIGLLRYYIDSSAYGHGKLDDVLIGSVLASTLGAAVLAGGIVLTVRGRTTVKVSRSHQDGEDI